MVSQPYVDGITDTVSDGIASSLTAGQIAVLTASSTITGHRHISLYPAGSLSNCTRQSRELRS